MAQHSVGHQLEALRGEQLITQRGLPEHLGHVHNLGLLADHVCTQRPDDIHH